MPRRGFPWAVLMALILVALLEFVFRTADPTDLIRYGRGLGSYYEVLHTLEAGLVPDVVVLGSSRGREAVVAPELATFLSEELGRPISVGNFSIPDAKADEIQLITERMMSLDHRPRALVYFVSPRVFHGHELNPIRREVFGVFPDQYGRKLEFWLASLSERPTWELRNWIGRHYATFRYRYRIRNQFTSWIRRRPLTSPIQGELTDWQRFSASRSLESHPNSPAVIRSYVERLLDDDGRYPQSELRWQALTETVQLCRRNQIPVFLVGSPLSPDLKTQLPEEVFVEFSQRVAPLGELPGVKWVELGDLGLELSRADFREHSHLNLSGSRKVTAAVARQLLVPELERD